MVVYGVGGFDDVTFVGDVHGLVLLWVEVSKYDSHRCRALQLDMLLVLLLPSYSRENPSEKYSGLR